MAARPREVRAIDLMLDLPSPGDQEKYSFLAPLLLDRASREQYRMPAEHLFKQNIPDFDPHDDFAAYTVAQMDAYGIERAMISLREDQPRILEALNRFPDRFFPSLHIDPNRGMDTVREIERTHREYGIKAVTAFPAGLCPPVPINDKKWYPVYAKCVELDLPICTCVGVPGPRIPLEAQKVEHIDEVCWFFPDLKFVMRHGAEPWTELAVKLMLKYEHLYYSTSAYAPKYYPRAIVEYANTRGADKIMYAGYFPMGLSLERIHRELADVPFQEHVWPKFLRENALRVFHL